MSSAAADLSISGATPSGERLFRPRLPLRRALGATFAALCVAAGLVAIVVLALLLGKVMLAGWKMLTPEFFSQLPSRIEPAASGLRTALWGTVWLFGLTTLVSVPLGVGAAIYLEEFAPRNRLTRLIHLNISNLAGVPSVVYGILGLAMFVRWLGMGYSLLAGALTLSLLVLPVIIISAREAINAVPKTLREAAYAVGCTRWQMVWHHVLPSALPGVLTGVILALSRAIGESAPLIMLGVSAYITWTPGGSPPSNSLGWGNWVVDAVQDRFSALPVQIYDWAQQPQAVFQDKAAAGIVVLLGVLLTMNAIASALRAWKASKLS
jgi:phosphate transport system permease protein